MDPAKIYFPPILKNFVSAVAVVNIKLQLIFYNHSFAQLTGYNEKRMKAGNSLFDYLNLPEGKELFVGCIDKIKATGQSGKMEIDAKGKDGKELQILINIIPFKDMDGKAGFVLDMVDISVEKKLHEITKNMA